MKTVRTVLIVLVIVLLLNATIAALADPGIAPTAKKTPKAISTPRPTQDKGRHQGDYGMADNPGNPQRPIVNPAGHFIGDNGEPDIPDTVKTPVSTPETTPEPSVSPTPVPAESTPVAPDNPGNNPGESVSSCLDVQLCPDGVYINGLRVTVPYTVTVGNVVYAVSIVE